MRSFSTSVAAAAIGVDLKTLDNVLAREARGLIARGRRGRSRRIPFDALERIAIALVLNRDFGVGVAKGIELAGEIVRLPGAPVAAGSLTTIAFDVTRLRAALEASLDAALEAMAEQTRGRPPAARNKSKAGRLA